MNLLLLSLDISTEKQAPFNQFSDACFWLRITLTTILAQGRWWVAKGLCDILELTPRDSVRCLDDDEKLEAFIRRLHDRGHGGDTGKRSVIDAPTIPHGGCQRHAVRRGVGFDLEITSQQQALEDKTGLIVVRAALAFQFLQRIESESLSDGNAR